MFYTNRNKHPCYLSWLPTWGDAVISEEMNTFLSWYSHEGGREQFFIHSWQICELLHEYGHLFIFAYYDEMFHSTWMMKQNNRLYGRQLVRHPEHECRWWQTCEACFPISNVFYALKTCHYIGEYLSKISEHDIEEGNKPKPSFEMFDSSLSITKLAERRFWPVSAAFSMLSVSSAPAIHEEYRRYCRQSYGRNGHRR